MSYLEGKRSQIILEAPKRSCLVNWVKLGLNHGLSCCNKNVTTRFASPYAILQRRPYSISLCRLVFPVTKVQRKKYKFFPLVRILHPIQQAYT
jgi:hypothetical protein